MKKIFFCCAILISFAACKQTQSTENSATDNITSKSLQKEIKNLEKGLLKDLDVNKNRDQAQELVVKSELFFEKFPKEKETPTILFKAADVSRGLGEYGKAIQLWGTVWRTYPNYDRAADALFLQGFTFENNLQDKQQARSYYEQFLSKFPDHKLAKQVKLSLDQLNLSPEELIKSFEKQQ